MQSINKITSVPLARRVPFLGIAFLILIFANPVFAQVCTSPPANLVSWWRADGDATDFIDGNHGTLYNGATFAPGKVGQAFQLDGVDDFVNLGNAPNLHVSTGDFTAEAWVYFSSLGTPCGPGPGCDMSILDKMGPGPNGNGWRLLKQADSHFLFCLGGVPPGTNACGAGQPTSPDVRSTTAVLPGVWYHVAAVKSSSAISIYVNGILEATKPLPAFTDTNGANLNIGFYPSEGAFLHGLVDEASIYNRALSTLEIMAIFAAGSAGKCTVTNSPPACAAATSSASVLWPPNHGLESVNILNVTDPDDDPVTVVITSIFQDEPVNGTGEGDTSPDGFGIGMNTAQVRAERAGGGNGRVYHVSFSASDGRGGLCSSQVLVSVPKNQGHKGGAIDDGALYDSTLP